MNVIEQLQSTVTRTTGLSLHYQSLERLNNILDDVSYPCAYMFLIETAGLVHENNRLKERLTLSVCFTNKTEYDFESIANETIIDACKQYATNFVLGLQSDDNFRLVSVNGSDRIYDTTFDVILTGYSVNVTIEELKGKSDCED